MSDTLQEAFDTLYHEARRTTIMLGQFSGENLEKRLGQPITVLPLACTVALESKWATVDKEPEEELNGRWEDLAAIIQERLQAEIRQRVINEAMLDLVHRGYGTLKREDNPELYSHLVYCMEFLGGQILPKDDRI